MAGRFSTRRRFLEIVGVGAGIAALDHFSVPRLAVADAPEGQQLLLFVYFSGGWDQLLCWDPRPNNDPKYQVNAPSSGPGKTGIFPAYDRVTDPAVKAVLATNASGVQKRGNLSFGPAVPETMLVHASDLCIVRGLAMDTLAHDVGQRYFVTGKFPRGLAPNGSSLASMVAALEGNASTLPNLTVDTGGYNEGQPAFASPVRVNDASDMLNVLKPIGTSLSPESDQALQAFEQSEASCARDELDADGSATLFEASRDQARLMVQSSASTLFSYSASKPMEPLFSTLDIGSSDDLKGAKGKAAIAALALEHGLSQAVSLEMVDGLDDHAEWSVQHATTLGPALDTLGRLIGYLKQADYKGSGGGKVWDRTTLVVFSEFARTPLLNARSGRDHHLTSSCLLAGPGIVGDLAVGASSDLNMDALPMNLTTGAPDAADGHRVRPADVHATVLASMGLAYDHLSNQSPKLIQRALS